MKYVHSEYFFRDGPAKGANPSQSGNKNGSVGGPKSPPTV